MPYRSPASPRGNISFSVIQGRAAGVFHIQQVLKFLILMPESCQDHEEMGLHRGWRKQVINSGYSEDNKVIE